MLTPIGTSPSPQAGLFDKINFCHPPRGILTLDEDVVITKSPRSDGDGAGDMALVIQGNGQRWKLGSEVPGEISRWEEVRENCDHVDVHEHVLTLCGPRMKSRTRSVIQPC